MDDSSKNEPLHVLAEGQGEPIVLVHGSGPSWGVETFSAQLELANRFRLLLVDRRGFGDSPPRDHLGFGSEAEEIAEVLGEGAHLVGHSYGGVLCLIAASHRPESTRSLTVIEPPALGLARGNSAVENFIARMTEAYSRTRNQTETEFWRAFLQAFGFEKVQPKSFNEKELRGIRASMLERPPWEAEIPLQQLASTPFPKLVVSGGWRRAPKSAQEIAGAALRSVCDVLERELDADRVVFDESAHNPQLLGKPFNERLEALIGSS